MSVLRISDTDAFRPVHVILIALVLLAMAGGMLLMSAARPVGLPDGAIPWQEDSILRAVIEILSLNYQLATEYAGAIKNYLLGISAGLAAIVLSLGVAIRTREQVAEAEQPAEEVGDGAEAAARPGEAKTHIAPLLAAQALAVLYLLWSFASSRWSRAPELALGGSILLGTQLLWALTLGHGLNARAARLAGRIIVGALAVTAVVAIWYHYGRNPTIRADVPVGNPAFLAAAMTVAILLALGLTWERIAAAKAASSVRWLLWVILPLAVIAICGWAFSLTGSRGPSVGFLFGLLAMAFFVLRGRWKWAPVILAALISVGGAAYMTQRMDAFSPTGRSATARLRLYAWDYALRMFNQKPLTGHGQGGFVLIGDSFAVEDVLDDPQALENRIAHAHNEWLEVMADLGSIGIVLMAAAVFLTLRAGMVTLAANPPPAHRWTLIALMAALVALVVGQCFDVGLRVAAVPTLFYTVLGLTWALSTDHRHRLTDRLAATRARRLTTGVAGCAVGLTATAFAQQDFRAARDVHESGRALTEGDYDEGVRLARAATEAKQLSPQRSLVNLYRLTEAHLGAAAALQSRAIDRQQRGQSSDPPNQRLLALAAEDFTASSRQCEEASHALKELLVRSERFINHGRLGYQLNLIRAQNPPARSDPEKYEALLQSAASALEREMARQPFETDLAVQYARVTAHVLPVGELIEVLARPLRHNRITSAYIDFLARYAAGADFDERFAPVVASAATALHKPPTDDETSVPIETWAPETLRLAAAVHFIRGDYEAAVDKLELAATAYDRLSATAALGAASCYAELADCLFFSNPKAPRLALESAAKARLYAPASREGRRLDTALRNRMVDYHLAADDEPAGRDLLATLAPPNADSAAIDRELGGRYRNLCESLLSRRGADGQTRALPPELIESLRRWIARALELNPGDPRAHFLAADLAFHVGEDEKAVSHLREALELGLPPEAAYQFLTTALSKREEGSEPLERLLDQFAVQPPAATDPPARRGEDGVMMALPAEPAVPTTTRKP